MTLMFTVVSWLPVPLVKQMTGPRATTVNNALTVAMQSLIFDICLLYTCLILFFSLFSYKCSLCTSPAPGGHVCLNEQLLHYLHVLGSSGKYYHVSTYI